MVIDEFEVAAVFAAAVIVVVGALKREEKEECNKNCFNRPLGDHINNKKFQLLASYIVILLYS